MVKYERTTPGNKYCLTIDEHVFPAASIKRFCGADGRVDLCDVVHHVDRRAKPKDDIFCAKRAWNYRAEAGYMKRIEDKFQDLAGRIVDAQIAILSDADTIVARKFYALWDARSQGRTLPEQEIQFNAVTGGGLSKDQEEQLEKHGVMFARAGGRVPARFMNGIQLQKMIDYYMMNELRDTRWGIIQAPQGEFLVPDAPLPMVIPLSPTLCLAGAAETGVITLESLTGYNRAARAASRYYFAHDISACPL